MARFIKKKRTWQAKFQDAIRGLRRSVKQQSSYRVHFTFVVLVGVAAAFFHFDPLRWALIIFAMTLVIMAEMFNTSLEVLSRKVTEEESPMIALVLDIASAAVLIASIGAALVGFLLFGEAAWIRYFAC